METSPAILAGCIFVCVFAGAMAIHFGYFARMQAIEERLAGLALKANAEGRAFDQMGIRVVRWLARRLPDSRKTSPRNEKTRRMLDYAGFHAPTSVNTFLVLRILAVVASAMAGVVAAYLMGAGRASIAAYAVAGAIAGNVTPVFVLGRLATLRQRAIRRELGDTIDLLVVCIESGLGLYQAIRTVGREAQRQQQKVGSEIAILTAGISSGGSLGQALRAMAERTGVEEMKSLAAILIQSEKLGSQLGPALRATSDTLRTRRRLAAEEAAQKSTIKMLVPLVLLVLPSMMAVILGPAAVQIFRNFHGRG